MLPIENTVISALESCQDRKLLLLYSGGVDSTVLLHILHKHQLNFDVLTVIFTKNKEQRSKLDKVLDVNHKKIANRHYIHEYEDQYRNHVETRNYLHKLTQFYDKDVIITAHNKDENIETLFMRLIKGTGYDGLKGMKEASYIGHVLFMKPLLSVSKKEICEYAALEGLTWWEDPTNEDPEHCDRNYLRNVVLPVIYERFGSKGIESTIKNLNEDLLFKPAYPNHDEVIIEEKGELRLHMLNLIKYPPNDRVYFMKEFVRLHGYTISKTQMNELKKHAENLVYFNSMDIANTPYKLVRAGFRIVLRLAKSDESCPLEVA